MESQRWRLEGHTLSSSRARVVLVGLLVLLTYSSAPASGRKPPREEVVEVATRPLSANEVMDILHKFPEMVPSYLRDRGDDTALLKYQFPFREVAAAPMERFLPKVRFYQGLNRSRSCGAEYPYMLAIEDDKRYWMPAWFNRLLFDNGIQLTDKNITGLAKALLVASVGSDHYSYPDITFLEARRKNMEEWATDAVQLKTRIGGKEEEWHFYVLRKQFEGATRVDDKGALKDYSVMMVESPRKR